MRWVIAVCGLAMIGAELALGAQTTLPPGGSHVISTDALSTFQLQGGQKQLGKMTRFELAGQQFPFALRASTAPGATAEWNVQLVSPVASAVQNGDIMLAHFWLRCAESMTGDGFVGFVFELGSGDFVKSVEQRLAAGGKWRECFVPFAAQRDYAAGDARVCLRLGYDRQTVEIGGFELINYGKDVKLDELPRNKMTYAGREVDAAWRKDALSRIDKLRKGDLTVTVTDAAGKLVAGAKVRMTLKRHDFGFGTCVTVEQLLSPSPDAQKYRAFVEKYCNLAVFENDMKWPAMWDSIPPTLDQALDWLLARRIAVRGHNLIWPSWKWAPPQLKQYANDPVELRRRTCERVSSAVAHFKGKLFQWDVVNEPITEHDLLDVLGRDVMVEWFGLAHQADPDCQLYLNDFGILDGGIANAHRQGFFDRITMLKERKAPIGGIGIQSHFGSDLPPPTQLLAVWDQFSKLDLPIESTELSVNVDDPQVQADYLRDYMTAAFSHPNVRGIMLWGFWEGRHWRPRAALYAKDWTIRPIGQAFVDLVGKEWSTNVEVQTDGKGIAKTRGFNGDYDIVVSVSGSTTTASGRLTSAGAAVSVGAAK